MASRWLLDYPETSEQAERLAQQTVRKALWLPLAILVAAIAYGAASQLYLDEPGVSVPLLLTAVGTFAFLQARAMAHKEAYHRLKDLGR